MSPRQAETHQSSLQHTDPHPLPSQGRGKGHSDRLGHLPETCQLSPPARATVVENSSGFVKLVSSLSSVSIGVHPWLKRRHISAPVFAPSRGASLDYQRLKK